MYAGAVKEREGKWKAVDPPTAEDDEVQDDLEEAVAIFVGARPRLLAIAYRILGSGHEAEDVVQDTWLRWQLADRAAVLNPRRCSRR